MKPEDEKRLEEIREVWHEIPDVETDIGADFRFLLALTDKQAAWIEKQKITKAELISMVNDYRAELKELQEVYELEDKENQKLLAEVNGLRAEVERFQKKYINACDAICDLEEEIERLKGLLELAYAEGMCEGQENQRLREALKKVYEYVFDDALDQACEEIKAALEGNDDLARLENKSEEGKDES